MTTEEKIDKCRNINWYALTNDQLNHILEIAGTPIENLRDRPSPHQQHINALVRSPNCIGCGFPHGGLCGPCYRRNTMRTLYEISEDLTALEDILTQGDGEISDDEAGLALEAWFDALGEERDAKIDNYCALIADLLLPMLMPPSDSEKESE